jgi:CheY-like chemotaxis protein
MTKKLNLLVVDDEEVCLISLSMQLYGSNINTILSDNAAEALKIIKTNPNIDVILLDLMMPDMDGFEFLDEVKKYKLFQGKPIIVQTGLTSNKQIELAMKKGATDHIVKPFEKRKLFQILEKYLEANFISHKD